MKKLAIIATIATIAIITSRLPAADTKTAETRAGAETKELTFESFQSSCIDLGHYDTKANLLTVRFVNKKRDRFYRYSNVSATVWEKLKTLNEVGGVGGYLNEAIVGHPDRHPFKEVTLTRFKIKDEKKKAGN